jgi:hypothetical protein
MLFKIVYSFAQTGTSDAFTTGAITSQSLINSWNNQWLDLLQNNTNNNIYRTLTNLGIFFAVGTLLFFMLQWLKDVLSGEYSRPISALIWPFLVVVLLNNTAKESILADLTLGVRNYLNMVNQQVIATADADQNYQQALSISVAEEVAGSLLRPCQLLQGNQQNQCFLQATGKINILWQEYRNLYGNKFWIDRLENKVNQLSNRSGNISETSFNALLGSNIETTIKNFLVSLQYAFQNLIEATMLLVAALGPVAVGGSLLPVKGKPIFAWLTAFLSLGIAKISFNIMAILTATVILNGPGQDANADPDLMWFMIFLGILAPIVSLVLAIGGGLAVFNAINNRTT